MVRLLTIEVDAESMAEALVVVGRTAKDKTRKTMRGVLLRHQQRMVEDRFRGYSGTKGSKLQRRSGTLARSIRVDANIDGDVMSAYVVGAKYAQIQELGGTVSAKPGKYLTIPLDAALRQGGTPRQQARLVNRGGSWHTASQVPGADGTATFIRKSKKGTPIIFVQGKGGKVIPLYALARSVKIKPRFGYMSTWDKLGTERERQWQRALDATGQAFVTGALA